eukprot:9498366-Pyramimonas_sp.AAC.3
MEHSVFLALLRRCRCFAPARRGDWDKVAQAKTEYFAKKKTDRTTGGWTDIGADEGVQGTHVAVMFLMWDMSTDCQRPPQTSMHWDTHPPRKTKDKILHDLGWRPEIADTPYGQRPLPPLICEGGGDSAREGKGYWMDGGESKDGMGVVQVRRCCRFGEAMEATLQPSTFAIAAVRSRSIALQPQAVRHHARYHRLL